MIRDIKIIAEGHIDLSRKLDEALKGKEERELILIRLNHLEYEVGEIKKALNETHRISNESKLQKKRSLIHCSEKGTLFVSGK